MSVLKRYLRRERTNAGVTGTNGWHTLNRLSRALDRMICAVTQAEKDRAGLWANAWGADAGVRRPLG